MGDGGDNGIGIWGVGLGSFGCGADWRWYDDTGAEKKNAAMSLWENALATVDAVAAREIVNPEKFHAGISKIIDGTVQCLNASTWAKSPTQASSNGAISN